MVYLFFIQAGQTALWGGSLVGQMADWTATCRWEKADFGEHCIDFPAATASQTARLCECVLVGGRGGARCAANWLKLRWSNTWADKGVAGKVSRKMIIAWFRHFASGSVLSHCAPVERHLSLNQCHTSECSSPLNERQSGKWEFSIYC